VDGQGIYCLDAGISDEYQPETDVEFVLEKLVIGSAVAMAVVFQSEFRRFLEQLGAENFSYFNRPVASPNPDSVIDEIVDAVKELSKPYGAC